MFQKYKCTLFTSEYSCTQDTLAEGITCTKYFEIYLSLSPDEESDDPLDLTCVLRGVPVDLLEPPGVT